MRYVVVFISLATMCLTVAGQASDQRKKTQELPPDLRNLLNAARMASPESRTDALLRLATQRRLTGTIWPRELIEEAYLSARQVEHVARMTMVPVKGDPVDSRAGYLSYAFDQELDSYSLLSRAIRQMLTIDKDRARQLVFELNGRLSLKKTTCTDTLAYDVSDIYKAVEEVARSGFRKKEIDDGVRALFLVPWFEDFESPSQVGPALDLLIGLQSSPVDRRILSAAMARGLAKYFDDDRAFTYSLERDRIPSKIYRLTTGIDDPSKAELRSSYREFLIRNLSGSRCVENEISGERLPDFVVDSNRALHDKPIQFREISGQTFEGKAELVSYWRSDTAKRLSNQIRRLRAAKPSMDGSDGFSEWESQVVATTEDLRQWNSNEDETESEVFHQKCVLFLTLADLAPEMRIKKPVVLSYMRFLNASGIQKKSFIEWNHYVTKLAAGHAELFRELSIDVPNPHFQLILELKNAKL